MQNEIPVHGSGSNSPTTYALRDKFAWVSRDLWALGFSAFLITCSAAMLFGASPLFITATLGMGSMAVGILEAISEPASLAMKFLSGAVSDYLRKRKRVIALGYLFTMISKPIFGLASGMLVLTLARILERLGNGLLASPRDALSGELAPKARRGEAFGLITALKTFGGCAGSVVLFFVLTLSGEDYKMAIWVAAIPAILALFVLYRFVHDPDFSAEIKKVKEKLGIKTDFHPINQQEFKRIRPGYWVFVIIASVFTMARFSEAFMILRFVDLGESGAMSQLLGLGFMNLVSALSAYPAGYFADYYSRSTLLIVGFLCLVLADVTFVYSSGFAFSLVGVVFWGIQRGMTQTLISAVIAEETPHDLLGTAFGIFHLLSGAALFFSSIFAGYMGEQFGSGAPFFVGMVFASLATILLMARSVWKSYHPSSTPTSI